jgi:FHA domain
MARWSHPLDAAPTPFRIRVGNEEVSLLSGVTLIGRDATCRIAVHDPLISRRHARIQCGDDSATIEDIGSRNGTRLNGLTVSGPHALRDGDRIGVGTCELVFNVISRSLDDWSDVPTGVLSVCASCKTPYPATAGNCPHCGEKPTVVPASVPSRSEDTVRGRWSLGMLLEMLGKTILLGKPTEVDKLMREVAIVLADQLRSHDAPSAEELRALREAAVWLDKAQARKHWLPWLTGIEDSAQSMLSVTRADG